MRRRSTLALTVAACALVATACGSSATSAGQASTSTSAAATGTTGAAGATPSTAAAAANGTPITIGSVSLDTGPSVVPDTTNGIEAWASYVNAHGGLSGHPVKVKRCDEAGQAQTGEDCYVSMVNDPSVVGIVSGTSRYLGTEGLPLLTKANLALIDPGPGTVPEGSATTGIDLTGGTPSIEKTLVVYAQQLHDTTIAFTHPDSAPYALIASTFSGYAKQSNVTLKDVPWTTTTTDFAPAATDIASTHAGMVVAFTGTNDFAPLVLALKQAGYQGTVCFSSVTAQGISAAGSAANGVCTVATFLSENQVTSPQDKQFYQEYDAAIKSSGYTPNQFNLTGFLGGYAFGYAAEKIGVSNLNRASLLNFVLHESFDGLPLLPATVQRGSVPNDPTLSAVGNSCDYIGTITAGNLVVNPTRICPFQS
jgi:ABC-type branched-subunit amino acid transport system substrate-binding protein